MTVRDFMARVVPWPMAGEPGVVNVHWLIRSGNGTHKFWGGRPHVDVDQFLGLVDWAKGRPQTITDIYYCLSMQAKLGKFSRGKATAARSAADAISLKAIWLDVDVKAPPKGYTDLHEALQALKAFLQASNLPWPNALVGSGGGLHVYWISDRPLSVDEWRPYAEGLKAAAQKHGLRADYGVTTDPARVLRVPGTFNYKTDPPKEVKLLSLDPDYNFETVFPHLATMVPVQITATVSPLPAFDLSAFQGQKPHQLLTGLDPKENLADGIGHNDLPPLDPKPVLTGCPFYRDAFNTHGRDHGQPLWNLTVLGTVFMQNGRVFAHELGNGHPGYTAGSTDEMYDRKVKEHEKGLGWPSCRAFENEGSKFCASCPHRGKIKSPLHLALNTPPPPAFTVTAQAVQSNPVAQALKLPANYGVDPRSGFVCAIVSQQIAPGQPPVQELVPLLNCEVRDPWADDQNMLHFHAKYDPSRWNEVVVSMIDMATPSDCVKRLAAGGCHYVAGAEIRIKGFLMAWLRDLTIAKEAHKTHPFGWWYKEGDTLPSGFAFGGKVLHSDGTQSPAGFIDRELKPLYTPMGDQSHWDKAFNALAVLNRPDYEIIVATAFAAPLMKFAGGNLYCYTFMACGETGSGKSSALQLAMSVWGDPKRTKERGSTLLSMINKLGIIKNIPMFQDEIKREEQEWLYKLTFDASEGIERGRLRADLSQQKRGDWQTTLVTCSNRSIFDFVLEKQKDTDAGVARIFEINVKRYEGGGSWNDFGTLLAATERNYGHLGMRYAEMLARDPSAAQSLVKYWIDRVNHEMGATNPERFWVAAVATIMAGVQCAEALGVPFHRDAIYETLKATYALLRDRVAAAGSKNGSLDHTLAVLNDWLREHMGNMLWTKSVHMGKGRPLAVEILAAPDLKMGKEISGHWVVDEQVLRISRSKFNQWLVDNEYSSGQIASGLKRFLKSRVVKVTLGGGTQYSLLQERLYEIPVGETSPLAPMLWRHTPEGERPASLVTLDTEEAAHSPTGIEAAVQQAADDLALVRSQT